MVGDPYNLSPVLRTHTVASPRQEALQPATELPQGISPGPMHASPPMFLLCLELVSCSWSVELLNVSLFTK